MVVRGGPRGSTDVCEVGQTVTSFVLCLYLTNTTDSFLSHRNGTSGLCGLVEFQLLIKI